MPGKVFIKVTISLGMNLQDPKFIYISMRPVVVSSPMEARRNQNASFFMEMIIMDFKGGNYQIKRLIFFGNFSLSESMSQLVSESVSQ